MPKITANNANFNYELVGTGQPVILISGYSSDRLIWLPILEDLAQRFQVLIFDNRGSGQTTDNGQDLSVELMAQDTMALAHALGLQKPHVVGHSMGGTIAQYIAQQFTDEISKLVILASSAKWRLSMLKGMKSSLAMRENNTDINLILDNVLPWLFGEVFLQNNDMVQMFKQLTLNNPFPQSLLDQTRQYKALEAFNGLAALKNIKAPTLVAYGREDIISLPHESHFMAQQIPNARLVEFNCAHMLQLEATDALRQELLNYF